MASHDYHARPATLHRNDEIFVASVFEKNEKVHWSAPAFVLDAARARWDGSAGDAFFGSEALWQHARWMNGLLGFPAPVAQCRLSASLSFPAGKASALSWDPATIWNGDAHPELPNDRNTRTFRESKWAAAVLADGRLVSICHADNPALSIHTERGHRGKGHARSCLSLFTRKLVDLGVLPGYGTDAVNVAAIRTAESVGYVRDGRSLWYTLPSFARDCIPKILEESMKTYEELARQG